MASPRSPRPLRVAAVQLRFAPTLAENLAQIADATATAAQRGARVVLFPECATTGYRLDWSAPPDRAKLRSVLTSLGALARRHRVNLLVGTPFPVGGRWFNSLCVFNAAGQLVHRYDKVHLTPADARFFTPGNAVGFFRVAGVPAAAIICHERRFPELVRLPVMLGARIVFHPNAGLDSLAVSKTKRGGRDGIAARAFENQVFYVFANSVGPQGGGRWSAGDSKIVSPGMKVLALADHRSPAVLVADLDLAEAGRMYAREALEAPAFLRPHWRRLLAACRRQLARQSCAPTRALD